MGSVRIRIDCRVGGPLTDGLAAEASEEWARNTSQRLADTAVHILSGFEMNKSGRSKGNFRESLRERRQSATSVTVPGMRIPGVTWGPWLEGITDRNKSTHFRGYHLFRKTRKELADVAEEIAQQELEKVKAKMGGE